MQYIAKNLLADEKLIYIVRPHWIVFAPGAWAFIFGILVYIFSPIDLAYRIYEMWTLRDVLTLVLFAVGSYWWVGAYIYFVTSEYGVTNKRVLVKVGWIQRKSLELLLDKVEGVLVDQTITGRLLGYGVITIIGTGGTNDQYPFIPDPLLFRKNVQQEVELYEEHIHKGN